MNGGCPARWAFSLFSVLFRFVHFLLAQFLFLVSIFLILVTASDFFFRGPVVPHTSHCSRRTSESGGPGEARPAPASRSCVEKTARRARAWRRPGRGRGRGLCTAQAAASSCFWKERGQQRHSAERPSTAVAEKTHRLLAGRPSITKEEERAQCPLRVPRGKQAPRGGKAAEDEPVEAAGFGSLKSCSRFSRDRKTARDEAGTRGK